jgi:UDP-N-acetylglucosamine 4,6-dehydratase
MNKNLRLIILLLNDLILCILTIVFSLIIRTDNFPKWESWSSPAVIAVVLYLVIFSFLKYQNSFFRYFNSKSLKNYFIGFGFYLLLFIALLFFFQFPATPKSIGLIQPILFFTSLIFSRYMVKLYLQKKNSITHENSLIIIGDADSISKLLDIHGENFNSHYLLSSKKSQWGRPIMGNKIQPITLLNEIISYKPKGLMIIDQNATQDIEKYWEKLLKCGLRFLQFKSGVDSFTLYPVNYHTVIFKEAKFKTNNKFYQNKTVLITGAGGSIGREIAKELIKTPNIQLILVDNNELNLFNIQKNIKKSNLNNIVFHLLNVLDTQKITEIFEDHKIDIIIHAAAYKHVRMLEDRPYIAIENNYLSTKILYNLAKNYKVKNFLLISTDKAVRPTSLMGVSKRLAELYCLLEKNETTKLSIVRFGNVINSSGSVLTIFIDQIIKSIPITVTHKEVKRYFMSIQQAAKLVLEANTFEESSIYHLDMGKPQNIYQMAKSLIKLYGYQPVTSSHEENNYSRLLTVIGLQKGEKLYEELLIDQKSQPTINKEIFTSIENIDLEKTKILLKEVNLYLDNSNKELLENILSNKLINYIKQK